MPTVPQWVRSSLLVVAFLGLASGCAGRRIPGTQIPENSDTLALIALIDSYRQAVERLDARAVVGMVAPTYFDDAGTPDPADDLDAQQLETRLTADFQKLAAARLDIAVRRVEVEGDRATAFVYYDEHYRIRTPNGEVAKQASDLHRMRFARVNGTWKFAAGL